MMINPSCCGIKGGKKQSAFKSKLVILKRPGIEGFLQLQGESLGGQTGLIHNNNLKIN